jgi:hypothetical protein
MSSPPESTQHFRVSSEFHQYGIPQEFLAPKLRSEFAMNSMEFHRIMKGRVSLNFEFIFFFKVVHEKELKDLHVTCICTCP